MSEPKQTSFYGLKSASFSELLEMVDSPDSQYVRDELKDRLPEQLIELFNGYVVAYQDREQAFDAINAELDKLKQ
ncbi:TPA: hypothetical protein ACXHSK_005227 [Klebsiella pneumoniae]